MARFTGEALLQALHGIYPPIVTPFTEAEQLDEQSLARLVDFCITEGVHGIWVCGTTGEFPCLDEAERARAVQVAVEAARGRVPVIASIGDCSTRLVIRHGRNALQAGADAVATTPPYYYANNQTELLDFFRRVRAEVDLPLLIYNIPSTCKVRLEPDSIATLAAEGTVIGIKDSQNDLDFFRQFYLAVRARGVMSFKSFLGTRSLIDSGTLAGADGCIPGIASLVPRLCVQVYEAAVRRDVETARELQERVLRVQAIARFGGGSPVSNNIGSIKAGLYLLGVIASPVVRHPLRTWRSEEIERLRQELQVLGVLPVAAGA
jgi:4-hydroxy-tetrahydrodipicolinate synthase